MLKPVGGSYDSRPALLVPGEPGGQQPVGGGWPSYGTSVLFTPVLPSGPLHSQPTPSSPAVMPLGGDMGTLQTKSTTDPAATRLIDDLANIKASPLYSIVVQNCISMGNPYCTKVLRILQSTDGKKALGLSRTSGLKGADSVIAAALPDLIARFVVTYADKLLPIIKAAFPGDRAIDVPHMPIPADPQPAKAKKPVAAKQAAVPKPLGMKTIQVDRESKDPCRSLAFGDAVRPIIRDCVMKARSCWFASVAATQLDENECAALQVHAINLLNPIDGEDVKCSESTPFSFDYDAMVAFVVQQYPPGKTASDARLAHLVSTFDMSEFIVGTGDFVTMFNNDALVLFHTTGFGPNAVRKLLVNPNGLNPQYKYAELVPSFILRSMGGGVGTETGFGEPKTLKEAKQAFEAHQKTEANGALATSGSRKNALSNDVQGLVSVIRDSLTFRAVKAAEPSLTEHLANKETEAAEAARANATSAMDLLAKAASAGGGEESVALAHIHAGLTTCAAGEMEVFALYLEKNAAKRARNDD
ncbi:hypothetical protein T492DRAFT_881697 [Pavlovales sp. CCMP2436]|nr:hypothetical protein T492DRAFT_881697 [Pavlovales sp. CCMP2436]